MPLHENLSYHASESAIRVFCTTWSTWNNRKRLNLTQSSILMWRFRCSCRRRFLNSLLKGCKTGSTVCSPYPKRLESLPICGCYYKGSTFSRALAGRSRTHDLPHGSAMLNQLSQHCAVLITFSFPPSWSKVLGYLNRACTADPYATSPTLKPPPKQCCFPSVTLHSEKSALPTLNWSFRALALVTATATTTQQMKNLIGWTNKNKHVHIWHALRNNSMLSSAKQLCEITTFVVFVTTWACVPIFTVRTASPVIAYFIYIMWSRWRITK